jgi:hypothetical protein
MLPGTCSSVGEQWRGVFIREHGDRVSFFDVMVVATCHISLSSRVENDYRKVFSTCYVVVWVSGRAS